MIQLNLHGNKEHLQDCINVCLSREEIMGHLQLMAISLYMT